MPARGATTTALQRYGHSLRQAHYPRMVFRISRTTTVRRSPLPDVVADAYADVPPGASHNSSFLQSRCGVSGRIFASHRRRRRVVVAAVAFRRGRDATLSRLYNRLAVFLRLVCASVSKSSAARLSPAAAPCQHDACGECSRCGGDERGGRGGACLHFG